MYSSFTDNIPNVQVTMSVLVSVKFFTVERLCRNALCHVPLSGRAYNTLFVSSFVGGPVINSLFCSSLNSCETK